MKDCDWCNQFHRWHFGAFTIIKGLGPVGLWGKGLVVPLHGVCGPIPLWLRAHCCLAQPTWQICHCGKGLVVTLPQQMWPPWCAHRTRPWQCTHRLWRTCILSLANLPYLTLEYLRCWLSCGVIWLSLLPANNNMKIWLLHGSHIVLPLHLLFYCCCSLQCLNEKKRLLLHWCCCPGIAINIIAGALCLCDCQCGWSTSMKNIGCCCGI